jgi:porphobilinogen deaminase
MQYVPLQSKYKVGTRQSELALIQTERYIEFNCLKIKTIFFV